MPALPAIDAFEYVTPRAEAARGAVTLTRRGVRHGGVRAVQRAAPIELPSSAATAAARERWPAARAMHLPGVLRAGLADHARAVADSLALFARLRRGASFQDEIWERLGEDGDFEAAGVTMDLGDTREIEKVFAHARGSAPNAGRPAARDLYAKLSWISHDECDESLRVRFSFGSEHLCEWQTETRRAPWADRLAGAVFPECDVLVGSAPLMQLVEACCGRRLRCSERIIYSNAPAGGAIFHNDEEPHQLGVLYGQLAGSTGWLALPKRELAAEVAAFVRGTDFASRARTPARALRWLESEDDEDLLRLLNHTPRFTRQLVEGGAFVQLRAGDALLLPSPSPEEVCWHSVFALGARPSLAHSYGLFARRR